MEKRLFNGHKMGHDSQIYNGNAKVYSLFSSAEDYPELILDFLSKHTSNKVLIDVGCGNGKYLNLLSSKIKKGYGIDIFNVQIKIALEKKRENLVFFSGSAEKIPLRNESVDVAILTWVLGSIHNKKLREKILLEAKRVIKNKGVVFIIENDSECEFENLIKRNPDISILKEFNEWLMSKGFQKIKSLKTYFKFSSLKEAKDIFSFIWGKAFGNRVLNSRINHNVNIFEWRKQK